MAHGPKRNLKKRVEAAVTEFAATPQSVGFHFRLNLASLLCELLDEKGWTQKQLAEAAGMKEAVVSRIINADSNCRFETAGRLLFALGVRAGDVTLGWKGFSRANDDAALPIASDKWTVTPDENNEAI